MTIRRQPATGAAAPTVETTSPATVTEHRAARLPLLVAAATLIVAILLGLGLGPVAIPPSQWLSTLLAHLPGLGFESGVPTIRQAIIWQLRIPRVLLAGLVGAMLASSGAAYQGVLRNSLADPYLLGVAAGAGLGATVMIIAGYTGTLALPLAAFAGAVAAVLCTYLVAAAGAGRPTGYAIILAGVAVAAIFSALQSYLQQRYSERTVDIYHWLLGSFSVASWSDIRLVTPYVALAMVILAAHRRILDVMRVGDDEATSLGVHPNRTRLVIAAAATLGTAAAVSVSGLIGFVGIVVPHAVRLLAHTSYRVVMPVSMIGGAAFLILADLAARMVDAPAEVPVGVITALTGGPFFLFVLRRRHRHKGVL